MPQESAGKLKGNMTSNTQPENHFLSDDHASSDEIHAEWDQDNQQWWDWYMSLAQNEQAGGAQLLELPAPQEHPSPSMIELAAELDCLVELEPEQIAAFRKDGFIKLKSMLSPEALSAARQAMNERFHQAGEQLGSQFGSLELMWPECDVIREFVMSRRLAKLAADLLGVPSIRLYHDNALSKQPGCGRTPWHYDAHHFPIATPDVCTVWIPLQEIPDSMGPLGFACGMENVELVADIEFNKFDTSYDRKVMERFRERSIRVVSTHFDLGEISFHHNFSFHTAGPNRTTTPRMVLANTYFASGARVIDNPHMVNGDWRRFMPGVGPGEVIDTELNPVLYSRP